MKEFATFLKLWLEAADKEIQGEPAFIGGALVSKGGLCPLEAQYSFGELSQQLKQALREHCGKELAGSGFPFNEGHIGLYYAECFAGAAHLNARRRAFVEATLAKLEAQQ